MAALDTSPLPAIRRLVLTDFRSYAALDLALDGRNVVLIGENGAGKTNLLEAVSLLTAGRGLRRAELSDLRREGGVGGWAVSVDFATSSGPLHLGTGIDRPLPDAPLTRRYRLDREPVASIRPFADHVRVVWLTPAMDGLFAGAAGDRRRFLDRLVLSVDAEHGSRVSALERALRNRNRLLEDDRGRGAWLDAAEREVAELAVAVAAARHETVSRLAALIRDTRDDTSAFPWADVTLKGEIEALVAERPSLEVEDIYRSLLRDNRGRDAAAGRTLIGPQASDLLVRHGPKQAEAARSSTGEQKALLVGLVLAHARLVASLSGIAPLVLLDEVAAHFDPVRRAALFRSLATLPGQVWMTGADPSAFAGLEAAQWLKVTPGVVCPVASGV